MVRRGACLVLAAAVTLTVAAPAGAQVLTPNLVQNPGAGVGGDGAGGVVSTIPSWTRSAVSGSNRSTVVYYGAPGFLTTDDAQKLNGGTAFFAGGPAPLAPGDDDNGPAFSEAIIGQDLEIPPEVAILLQSGGAQVTVAACLGGYAEQNDHVDMVLYQGTVDYSGDRLPGQIDVSGPRAADRGNVTKLMPRTATADLRSDTTNLGIKLIFIRASGADTYNDGYADNISVRISTKGSTRPRPRARHRRRTRRAIRRRRLRGARAPAQARARRTRPPIRAAPTPRCRSSGSARSSSSTARSRS